MDRLRKETGGGGTFGHDSLKGGLHRGGRGGANSEMEGKEDRIGLFSRDVASGAGLREALETSERGATWNGPLEGGVARWPPIGP